MGIWYAQLVKSTLYLTFVFFVLILVIYGFNESANRELIRWSARFSFTLFVLAFSASSIYTISKNSFSFWLRMNRKYLGFSFAIVHLIHLLFLLLLQVNFHPVFDKAAMSSLIGGGIAYLFVVLMLITSLDKFKNRLSAQQWKILHLIGGYWIWSIYMTSYFKRADTEPIHWLPVFLLLICLFLRLNKWIRRENKWSLAALALAVLFMGSRPYHGISQSTWQGDILIKNGTIIDGSGASKSFISDLLIKNGAIKRIGISKGAIVQVHEEIDAEGKVVTPGFIDIHAHGDPMKTPEFQNFLGMGVTSIALGMDGTSIPASKLKDWMNAVDALGTGVNIIPFIGHGTIRNESGIGVQKNPSENDINEMVKLLSLAMSQGCWGLSMGLEYIPGLYSSQNELEALAKSMGRYDGIITSHIRNEDDDQIESALIEMKNLARFCPVNISHLKVVFGKSHQRADEILDLLFEKDLPEFPITADLYPYIASYTGIGIVFPEWAKNPKNYKEIKIEKSSELLDFLKNKVNKRNGPNATLFGSGPYKGKTLGDLEKEYNLPFEIILKDIIGPYGSSAAFFVMNEELQSALMLHPGVMIASDGSPTMFHPRGYGTFSRVIEKFVVNDSLLSLENAVYKMTGLPARTIGLKGRGLIKEGYKADLLIFDPSDVRELASFENPHVSSLGIGWVLIDGKVSWTNGRIKGKFGQVLRK